MLFSCFHSNFSVFPSLLVSELSKFLMSLNFLNLNIIANLVLRFGEFQTLQDSEKRAEYDMVATFSFPICLSIFFILLSLLFVIYCCYLLWLFSSLAFIQWLVLNLG